ncbi:MAG TPA: transcriptional regulator [Acidimicrobiales bacterium]|nr:transcriptional regulator [Acidimicrobiales bacterium]
MGEFDEHPAEATDSYAETVGARLRAVRRQKRMSLQAVEAASSEEFKASVLGAYERGERAISVPRLRRLAQIYDVPLNQLLPGSREGGLEPDAEPLTRTPHETKIRIDLVRLKATKGLEAEALQRFLTKVQLDRQDFNGQVLTIRADDLRVIGATFGLGVIEMVERLQSLGLIYAA